MEKAMPRAENKTTPKVLGGVLYAETVSFSVGSQDWWAWLERPDTTLFYVETNAGTFTARREPRRNVPFNRTYWYAYRRQRSKLHKRYLGRSEELTLARLADVARQLAEALR